MSSPISQVRSPGTSPHVIRQSIIAALRPIYDGMFAYRDQAGITSPDTLCLLASLIPDFPGDIFSRQGITAEKVWSHRPGQRERPGAVEEVTNQASKLASLALQEAGADSPAATSVIRNQLALALLQGENTLVRPVLTALGADIKKMQDELGCTPGIIAGRPAGAQRVPGAAFSSPRADGAQVQGKAADEAQSALAAFGRDLTQLARDGRMDPIIGREQETDLLVNTLLRRKKNNAVIIGEAGVGKTALAESLAQKIAAGNVPEALKGKRIISLDMTALKAGTGHRGALEERVQSLLKAIEAAGDVILFIDELHTIVGDGASDVGNLLKPALSREGFQCIGATTLDEYERYIEKDAALERRFQPVRVEEPSEEDTFLILKGIISKYEQYHRAAYPEAIIREAVQLTGRYLAGRRQPDKSIDLIDAAGVRAAGGEVTRKHLHEVIALWTGAQVLDSDRDLLGQLTSVVVGQDKACKAVIDHVLGIHDERRPIGSILLCGPTGVGKTYLAEQLALVLNQHLVRLDMQNFQDSIQANTFLGAPPAYVGYDDSNQFIKDMRGHPQCVVLFDRVELAHPEILSRLVSILDQGQIQDNRGRDINFRQAVIIMTTGLPADPKVDIRQQLSHIFPPDFISMIHCIQLLRELGKEEIQKIVRLELGKIESSLSNPRLKLQVPEAVVRFLAKKGHDPASGARAVQRAIQEELTNGLAVFVRKSAVADGDVVKAMLRGNVIQFAKAKK
ncbi:MAG TPA: ATP-dependent Clp protease ATP-binding subunit [Candidatus Nanoarchaeia archaeon]|nr:ATP-dependent Clp protease ATP-binding subunit [Candidatus Nanoarchaeia archaeon]